MSLFLLQATPVSPQANKVGAGANGLFENSKIDLSDAEIAGMFTDLLNNLPNEMVNLLSQSNVKIKEIQNIEALPAGDYFAEIIAKAKILLLEKYDNNLDSNNKSNANKAELNIGAAPENIKSAAQMQDFWLQAAQLLQQSDSLTTTPKIENLNQLILNNSIIATTQQPNSLNDANAEQQNNSSGLQNIELTRQDIVGILQQIEQLYEAPQYQTQIVATTFNWNVFNPELSAELSSEPALNIDDVSFGDDVGNIAKIDIAKSSINSNLISNQNNLSTNLDNSKGALNYDLRDFTAASNSDIAPNINFETLANAELSDNAGANIADITSTDIKSLNANEAKDKNIPLIKFEAETASPNATPFEQISLQIKKLHKAKKGEINLQLNPHDLGKVDVSLSNDADNNMVIKIATELFDTYELLKNDKSSLEKMLSEVGIKMNDSSLQFSHNGREGQRNNNFMGGELASESLSKTATQETIIDNDVMQSSIMNLTATIGINIKV